VHISYLKPAYRSQLITALNTKPRRSNSSLSNGSRPTPKSPITLNKSDYPNVKHWERRQNDVVQVSVIKVHDTDSSDSDSESTDNEPEGITKKERGVLAFLEDENGSIISYCQKERLYAELWAFWNDNIDPNRPPKNWSSVGATLRNKFRDTIEEKFPFLHLCSWRWKVDVLWKRNYHSWKQSLLARQSKETPPGTCNLNDGGKRKQKESPDPAEPHGEADRLLDAPPPKKVKTGMTFIRTIGWSQKVHQLAADVHSIIRKSVSIQKMGDAGFTYCK